MATTVVEITGRSGTVAAEDETLRRIFLVTLPSVTEDGPKLAAVAVDSLTGLAVPQRHDLYPGSSTIEVVNQSVESIDTSFTDFIVTVEYSSSRGSAPGSELIPTSRPWEVEWSSIIESEAIDASFSEVPQFDGIPIESSAGVPFSPPYEIVRHRPVVTITRNEASFNAGWANYYTDKVNSDVFMNSSPQTALIMEISGRRFYEMNAFWWSVTYKILFKPLITRPAPGGGTLLVSGHALTVLDQGKYTTAAGGKVRILDANNVPFVDAVKLDGAGAQLPAGQPAVTLTFSVHYTVPFAPLGLQ